jgi:predicted RNA-binding Zn ribbon-like protein
MACYDLASLAVLKGDAYKAIGGPNLSVWSRRVLSRVVGYERLELEQAQPGDDVVPQGNNGKALLRFAAAADRDAVVRAAGELAATVPTAQLRIFSNALPDGQTTVMLDAPSLTLIPAWGPGELADAFGESAAQLVAASRYRRYQRWV